MCQSFLMILYVFFFFKQKTAYEMRISDWSSDVCSSDLATVRRDFQAAAVIGQIVGHLEGTIGLLLCEQPRQIRFVDRGVGRRESESAHQDAGQHAGIVAEGDFRRRLFSRPEIIDD